MTLPKTMRCIEISAPGGPEVLVVGERPLPVAGNGEVLIKVAAAGVNRADTSQRKGNYPVPPGAPDILGMEVSGTVVAVGAGVTQWKVGDALCALVAGGGYAEYCVAPAANCMPIPKGLTVIEGGALPETFMTVWSNVWDRAQLAPGESVLIQGGSSGIGVTAIQVAKALGHTVYATAGSAEKCAACEKLGADRAINYKTEDFVAVVKELTGGKGVDLIIDVVSGPLANQNMEASAVRGRIVSVGRLGGTSSQLDFNLHALKRISFIGVTFRTRSVQEIRDLNAKMMAELSDAVASAALRMPVDKTFPLDQAEAAFEHMRTNQHFGKVVLSL